MSQTPLIRPGDVRVNGGTFGVTRTRSVLAPAAELHHQRQTDVGTSTLTREHPRLQHSTSRSLMHRVSSPSLRKSRSKADSLASPALESPPIGLESLSARSTVVSDTSTEDGSDDEATPGLLSSPPEEEPSDNSIYPQVRASVQPTDNVHLSVNTPRMWILSLFFSFLGSSTNLFFALRYPSVAITPVIALVLVHPLGKAWDRFLKHADDPPQTFLAGNRIRDAAATRSAPKHWTTRVRLWLSQGKWNEKEHACVYICSNVSFGFAFATDVIVEQQKFYKQEVTIPYQLLLTVSSQILGYAFAGLTRRYLVRPPSMIWPGTLMSTAMFTTLHKQENKPANGWRISRWKFFILVWAGGFAWYFLPGLLMPALSTFNILTWFAPNNVVVANLFGVRSGLGLLPLTFDWAHVAYIGSPLLTPWWAAANVITGFIVVMVCVAPILYYSNVFFAAYMPIVSSAVFDNTGKEYDVTRILTEKFQLDPEAYKKYSPVYLPITFAVSYACQFAGLAALISHTWCWHGKDIWEQTKESFRNEQPGVSAKYVPIGVDGDDDDEFPDLDHARRSMHPRSRIRPRQSSGNLSEPDAPMSSTDVHNRLMQSYPDVPLTWYLTLFVLTLLLAIFLVEYYPVYLPWYGLLLALGITTLMFLPVAIIMAITNQHSSLYLISQLVCGAVFPGRPVANMIFVTFCYISAAQGIKFSSDLKLGHYMKIPPKLLFNIQVVATLLASFTQVGVLNWMFQNIPDLCTLDALNGFSCPIARVHFNGSILWGVVGPSRFFGEGALYRHLVWAFPIGFVGPLIVWWLSERKGAAKWLKKINLPVLLGTLSWMPPATGLNFSVWALVCYAFNHVVRRRAFAWWSKYTMTLSGALDFGLAGGLIVIFFFFQFSGVMGGFRWWGTEVYKQGCDWKACAYLKVTPGEFFGRLPEW